MNSYAPDSVETRRRQLDRFKAQLDHARRLTDEERRNWKLARCRLMTSRQAQKILQAAAEAVQQQAHRRLASVVTRCLKAVFGEEAYEFRIRFEQKRGKTEARLLFARDGLECDPVDAAGGGVVDVASFALRLACLLLTVPAKRKLLVLDEPLKHLSRQYRPAARQLIEVMAKEMGVQFIVVTHDPALVTGKVVEL